MKVWPVARRIMTYFCVAALLLSAATVARYTSLVSGNGTAEIAIPVVKLTRSGGTELKLKDDKPATYSFTVSNGMDLSGTVINSDVDMTYSVLVTAPKALLLEMVSMTLTSTDSPVALPAPTKAESGENYIYTYTAPAMRLPAGTATTHSFALTVRCGKNGLEKTGAVTIDVKAIQAN